MPREKRAVIINVIIINIRDMNIRRKLFVVALVCICVGCNEVEMEPDPLVLTTQDLIGTWVYDDVEKGVTEVMAFTADGKFFYSSDIEDIVDSDYQEGTYNLINDVMLLGGCKNKTLNHKITKKMSNALTIQDNAIGHTATYAKLIGKMQLAYMEEDTLDVAKVIGSVMSYKSHNERTVKVQKAGVVKAISEGAALVDVVTWEDGTAVVLVEADGLIPAYDRAIGYTKEEVKAIYGREPSNDYDLYTAYVDSITAMKVKFDYNRRTRLVERVEVTYGSLKGFTNSTLVDYLETKYYLYEHKDEWVFINKNEYAKASVKVEWDNVNELTFTYINHDLFEDFSVGLGKSRDEISKMYGEELILQDSNNDAEYVYKVGDEAPVGYAGIDKINSVAFLFNGEKVVSVTVKLKTTLPIAEVLSFFDSKYGEAIEDYEDNIRYYDSANGILIDYNSAYYEVKYNFEKTAR